MWWFITGLLLLLCIALGLRSRFTARQLRDLAEAVEERRSYLLERRHGIVRSFSVDRLQSAYQQLLGEVSAGSEKERGHLHQVETTLAAIREAVLIVDEANEIHMANDALRVLLGREERLVGKRLESLMQSAGFLDYVRGVKLGNKTAPEIIELVRGSEALWFEVHGGQLPRQENAPELTLFVLHDITHQVRLERMRTEFVANVSHELRTPVTIIKGFADTLAEDDADLTEEERARFLSKIRKNVARLNALLEDLLTLSRIEARIEHLQTETCSMNELLEDIAENFEARLENQGAQLHLELELEPENDRVPLDRLKITQVVDNLLDNVLRHAKAATQVRLISRREAAGVRCTVEDNGAGVPENDLPHLFERFYRVDKGRSRELGGTGLGLSICKHIIQLHGGEVFVESEVGEGTRIGFILPETTPSHAPNVPIGSQEAIAAEALQRQG